MYQYSNRAVAPLGSFPMQTLKSKYEFSKIFDKPDIKVVNSHFVVLARKNSLGYLRLGVVTPKKRARRSVDRNYLRRIIKNSLCLTQADIADLDIIVLLRQSNEVSLALKHKKELYRSLGSLWSRLKLKLKKTK